MNVDVIARQFMTRHFWLLLHRYAGLYLAFFLIVAGSTGTVLAFYHEIDGWLNPQRYYVPVQNTPLLDGFRLRELALAQEPHAQINSVVLNPKPGEVVELGLTPLTNPATKQTYVLDYVSIRLNPYSGEVVGHGQVEKLWPLSRSNLMSFIYRLHDSLALGELGIWLFGISALIWALDCFVGFYLTLPRFGHQAPLPANLSATPQRNYGQRWAVSWKIKWPTSRLRFNFDLHRAGGLWTWLMLLVFAWSAVQFNLPSVYKPVMSVFFNLPELSDLTRADLPQARINPDLTWQAAYKIGQDLMTLTAQQYQFNIIAEQNLIYLPEKNVFAYQVKSDLDMPTKGGLTHVFFDGDSGQLINIFLPSGQYPGLTLQFWLQMLHMAGVWGLPYKVFVCLMGLVVAMLSVTGVYIWLKKHQAASIKRKLHGTV
jgi:uncharacterized iron-regulated membrane protein